MKNLIRKILKEELNQKLLSEIGAGDWLVQKILKAYDEGTPKQRAAIGEVIAQEPDATRQEIIDELLEVGKEEINQICDDLGIDRKFSTYSKMNYPSFSVELQK